MNVETTRRYVSGYQNIAITDDFGNYLYLGDVVEIHVMPFDYKDYCELCFDEENCSFYLKGLYRKYNLSHSDEHQDMGARINVLKTFKKDESFK